MYESEEHFWSMMDPFLYATKSCKPLSSVTEYLSFAETDNIDGHIREEYQEDVSRLCRKQPDCFFNAVKQLSKETRRRLRGLVLNGLFWRIAGYSDADADRCFPSEGTPPSE